MKRILMIAVAVVFAVVVVSSAPGLAKPGQHIEVHVPPRPAR